jgi:hypothetical protein
MMAVLPSRRISAPMRRISSTCMKRFSKTVSMMVPVPLGDAVQRGELRLHVGGERRDRARCDVDGLRPSPAHVELDPVLAMVMCAPASAAWQHGVQVSGGCS